MTTDAQYRDRSLFLLAFIALFTLASLTFATLFAGVYRVRTIDELATLYGLVVAPLLGIFGPILGFCFAEGRR